MLLLHLTLTWIVLCVNSGHHTRRDAYGTAMLIRGFNLPFERTDERGVSGVRDSDENTDKNAYIFHEERRNRQVLCIK